MIDQLLLRKAHPAYLEHLLSASLGAPGAAGSQTGEVVAAELLLALAARGDADEVVDAHLLPGRQHARVFSVHGQFREPGSPAPCVDGLSAADALRRAAAMARDGCASVEVLGIDASGQERSLITRCWPHPFAYRLTERLAVGSFPPPLEPRRASAHLEDLLERQTDDLVRALGLRLALLPGRDDLVDAVRQVLGEMTLDVDLHGISGDTLGALITGGAQMAGPEAASTLGPGSQRLDPGVPSTSQRSGLGPPGTSLEVQAPTGAGTRRGAAGDPTG